MSLVDALRALMAERAQHVDAIAAIDRELTEARTALGLQSAVAGEASGASVPTTVTMRECARCGEPFAPLAAVSDRWCSQRCYEGVPIDERRDAIVVALRDGPQFAATLNDIPALKGVSRGTVHNDLQALRREGKVQSGENGWMLIDGVPDAEMRETAVPEPPEAPFVQQPPESLN